MRQALDFYIKGHVGKALLLYSRTAELGYEVGQSNAAWLLEKYRGGICLGSSGICTTEERHQRAHHLSRRASEQGNEHASLLLGDAYYYGRVCVKSSLPSCSCTSCSFSVRHKFSRPHRN
jgi:SEL1 protein